MSAPADPIAPADLDAAHALWEAYAAARPAAVRAAPGYTVEAFGDSARLADELLDLVLTGRKRATAELVAEFTAQGAQLPRVGGHWIACDGAGRPRVVLRSTELRLGPSTSCDERFAFDEGEGDRSLDGWRREHRRYWERTRAARGAAWSEDDEVVFERFTVVWPPERAG